MKKGWIIVVGVIILIAIITCIFAGIMGSRRQPASDFGITEKGRSALVIQNSTTDFFIWDVSITGEEEKKWVDLISQGEQKIYSILPGKYTVHIHYTDRDTFSNQEFLTYYVSDNIHKEFRAHEDMAVVFSLQGGRIVSEMYYDPPELSILPAGQDHARE